MDYYTVGGRQYVLPIELQKAWGGEYGHPIFNDNHEVIGYAAEMPNLDQPEVEIEAITTAGEKTTITA